jgi:hypothetical protein
VEVRGTRTLVGYAPNSVASSPGRFEYTAWYSPELKRYVKLRHRTWSGTNQALGDEQVELLEHRPN